MITVRRSDERVGFGGGFGDLEALDESRLNPGAAMVEEVPRDAQVVTYVREGALAQADSLGHSGLIQAGEFQRRTTATTIHHSSRNASPTDSADVFQLWIRPSQAGLEPGQEQKRFSAAQRRGGLCVIGSPDGRRGSLRLQQDILIFSAILDPGQHVVHALTEGRSAWLHLVQGEVILGDMVLVTGDGVGLTSERAVSLTARADSEVLLVDLG